MHLMNREFIDYVCATIKMVHAQYRHGIKSPEFLETYEMVDGLSGRLSSEDRVDAIRISLAAVHEMACSGDNPHVKKPTK